MARAVAKKTLAPTRRDTRERPALEVGVALHRIIRQATRSRGTGQGGTASVGRHHRRVIEDRVKSRRPRVNRSDAESIPRVWETGHGPVRAHRAAPGILESVQVLYKERHARRPAP